MTIRRSERGAGNGPPCSCPMRSHPPIRAAKKARIYTGGNSDFRTLALPLEHRRSFSSRGLISGFVGYADGQMKPPPRYFQRGHIFQEECVKNLRENAGPLLFRRLVLLVIRPDYPYAALGHLVPALIAIGVFATRGRRPAATFGWTHSRSVRICILRTGGRISLR
jgi:hypothetical protein